MKARCQRIGTPRSILILKPSSFGDIVHTLPAVARLRARWPESRISWLVNPEWSPLLRGNLIVDEVVIFPRQDFRGWGGPLRFRRWLRERIAGLCPDLALDYQGLLRTALIGRAARAGTFAGLADAREGARWLYDETVAVPSGVPHAVERYLALSDRLLAGAGGVPSELSVRSLQFPLPPGEPPAAAPSFESGYLLLHPFARGTDKSLTAAQVHRICTCLSPRQVVVVGRRPNSRIALPPNGLNLLNETSIPQLIWLIRQAAFVISVDSGPAHLAAALCKPMVAVHTWSDPRRVGPYRSDAWVLRGGGLLQVRDLPGCGEEFFTRSTRDALPPEQLDAICRLAISSSGSCA